MHWHVENLLRKVCWQAWKQNTVPELGVTSIWAIWAIESTICFAGPQSPLNISCLQKDNAQDCFTRYQIQINNLRTPTLQKFPSPSTSGWNTGVKNFALKRLSGRNFKWQWFQRCCNRDEISKTRKREQTSGALNGYSAGRVIWKITSTPANGPCSYKFTQAKQQKLISYSIRRQLQKRWWRFRQDACTSGIRCSNKSLRRTKLSLAKRSVSLCSWNHLRLYSVKFKQHEKTYLPMSYTTCRQHAFEFCKFFLLAIGVWVRKFFKFLEFQTCVNRCRNKSQTHVNVHKRCKACKPFWFVSMPSYSLPKTTTKWNLKKVIFCKRHGRCKNHTQEPESTGDTCIQTKTCFSCRKPNENIEKGNIGQEGIHQRDDDLADNYSSDHRN